VNLGFCYLGGEGVAKDEVKALKIVRKAAEGGSVSGLNFLAWALATSANPEIRNGATAVALAEKAVAATKRRNAATLDTLAAAYAETGQFEKAASTEQEAIALAQTEAERSDCRSRLRLFELNLPYRATN
jgi:uncharacterized protein